MHHRRPSSILSFMMFCSFLFASITMSAQSVTFLDAQGQAQTAPYLEGSRAYVRVIDPGAAGSVPAAISATRSGDYEPLELGETGTGTGVFEGSIELSIGFPSADGRLETGRDTSQYPWRFDDLVASYAPGMASAAAATVGSTVSTFDAVGASTTSYVVGDTIYLRVTDAFANSTPGIDSAPVNLSTVVGSWGEYQTVTLTETGGDTSIFTGSIQTVPGSAPIQQDGIFEVQPGAGVWVQHDDANGQTYSAVQLSIYPNLPPSLSLADPYGQPAESFQEFGSIQIRATDGALAGQWWGLTVRVTSDLRGDEEYVPLNENPFFSGIFTGSVTVRGMLSGAPVANDGILEVSEIAGSPVQRDTIRAEILDCSAAPCPTDTAVMTGARLRITDAQWSDLDLIVPPATIQLEALDLSVPYYLSTTATVTSGGDAETVTLDPAWEDPVEPQLGRFRGGIPVEVGAAVPGDGYLQVAASDVVTASRPDPLGLSSAVDTAAVGGGLLAYLDRVGEPVDYVLLRGDVRVRAFYPAGNGNPAGADSIGVAVLSRDSFGNVRDTETLSLVETGVDTSLFGGQMPSEPSGAIGFGNGVLETGPPYGTLDTIEATLDSTTATATLRGGILRFVDSAGADLTQVPANGAVYLRLESDFGNSSSTGSDQAWVRILSLSTGDDESFPLYETGADTATFAGSIAGSIGVAVAYDGALQTQLGETIRGENYSAGYQLVFDEAVVGEGTSTNSPPDAVDDAATTPDGTAITIDVKANDSDPEGQTLTVASFTQGAQGTVSDGGGGLLTYTPANGFSGTDTFTYRLVDGQGGEDVATVTVTVEFVNDPPIVYPEYVSTLEDLAVTINPIANDSDPEGQALTLDFVFPSSLGTAVITNAAAGTLLYTPNLNATGTDTVVYRVRDAQGATSMGFVDVTMLPVNDPPVAANDTATLLEDTSVTVNVLANDSDPDGDALSIVSYSIGGGAFGTLTLNPNKTLTFVPGANYNGNLGYLTYQVSDGVAQAMGVVSLQITPVNDPPVAVNDAGSVLEDASTYIAVLGNDSDVENQTLTVTAVTQGAYGSAVADGFGSVLYTPAANYNGADSFTYTISDGNGGSATATVSITVTAVNDAPSAGNDSGSVAEDGSASLSVLGNDSDMDGDTLAVTGVTQGAHGSVSFTAGGVTYTPVANYNGTDSFTYTIGDGNGGSATATVSVTVTSVNDSPNAGNDAATVGEDGSVNVSVLSNDTDLDGDTLSVTAVTHGAHGSVTFVSGSVTYTPAANYNGSDSFTYTIGDGNGGSATATVSVTVTAVNDSPNAGNDTGTVAEDGTVSLSVLDNDSDGDGDSLAVTAVTQGAHGSVSFTAGGVTYTPAANYNGADSFTYAVGDGNGGSATATVSITVTAVADAPSAGNDAGTVAEDGTVSLSVLANDADVDGDSLAVTAVTQGAHGSVSFTAGGVTYTPVANYNGADSFTYTIRDTTGLTATATVSLTVAAVNDPPDAINDAATTNEAGGGVIVTVLANDTDLDGDALVVIAVSTPAHGSATRNANNTITYVPVASYSGGDSFTYTISDSGATDTATVTIQVKDVIGRVAVLGTHSVSILTGADVLSGDVVVNQVGTAPFLGATEVSLSGGVTTASGWDVQGNRVTIAATAAIASDVYSNQLTNNGTVTGALYNPLALPIFASLPTLLVSTPGTSDVNVSANGTRTLAPGSYRDLIVGKKGTVTFTGGTYHFRSIKLSGSEAKLFFSAPSTVRVQQKVSTSSLAQIRPGTGSTATAATIVFHVAGVNGTGGGLAETPKAVEIGVDGTFTANLYGPNGTIWIKDRTLATGAFLGKDVQVGPNVQVTLGSAW